MRGRERQLSLCFENKFYLAENYLARLSSAIVVNNMVFFMLISRAIV